MMFSNLLKLILCFMIGFTVVFSPTVKAAEFMKADSVLTADSMVFSIDEADSLRKRIEELELLEKKEAAMEDLVEKQEQEIITLEELLTIKDAKINEWEKLSDLHEGRVKKLEKQEKFNTLENIGWFILGSAITGGMIYLGDKIGDTTENN